MSKKTWIIFSVVCVAILAGLVYMSSKDKIDVSNIDINKIQAASEQSGGIADHVFGKADSKVQLIEYGDFQCPGCGSAHPTIKEITEKYKGQMAFIFRNFPLTSIHPNARVAAATAEAAGLQGKYWEMHNKLYEDQSAWQSLSASERMGTFTGYATSLGLKVDTFNTDVADAKVTQKINFDLAVGKKAGVTATPSFFLGGKKMEGIYNAQGGLDPEKFEEVLKGAMEKEGIELPKN